MPLSKAGSVSTTCGQGSLAKRNAFAEATGPNWRLRSVRTSETAIGSGPTLSLPDSRLEISLSVLVSSRIRASRVVACHASSAISEPGAARRSMASQSETAVARRADLRGACVVAPMAECCVRSCSGIGPRSAGREGLPASCQWTFTAKVESGRDLPIWLMRMSRTRTPKASRVRSYAPGSLRRWPE